MRHKNVNFVPYPVFQNGNIENQLKRIREFEPHDDAVLMCSPWKSGTHWVYELTSMLLKQATTYNPLQDELVQIHIDSKTESELEKMTEYQILHTHLPISFSPTKHKETGGKIIYINRNPKDRHVSFFTWIKGKHGIPPNWNWNNYFEECVLKDTFETGWFNFTKEMIHDMKKDSMNIYSLMYEKLHMDTKQEVIRLAKFLEVPHEEKLIDEIIKQCSFKNMKKNVPNVSEFGGLTSDFRKGVVGDWKNWFTVAQNEQFDAMYRREMSGLDVDFIFDI